MRISKNVYQTLTGKMIILGQLSEKEKSVLIEIRAAYNRGTDWPKFANLWRGKVRHLYQNLPAKERASTVVYLIGEDLEARLGVSQKYFRATDYRDELDELITTNFRSRYAFCRATALDQGFLSRLLHKSTHISVERLNRALLRIGWELRLSKVVKQDSENDTVKTAVGR